MLMLMAKVCSREINIAIKRKRGVSLPLLWQSVVDWSYRHRWVLTLKCGSWIRERWREDKKEKERMKTRGLRLLIKVRENRSEENERTFLPSLPSLQRRLQEVVQSLVSREYSVCQSCLLSKRRRTKREEKQEEKKDEKSRDSWSTNA